MTQVIETNEVSLIGGGYAIEDFIKNIDPVKWAEHEIRLIDEGHNDIKAVMAGVAAMKQFCEIMEAKCKDGLHDELSKFPEWNGKTKAVNFCGWQFKNNGDTVSYDYANTGFVTYTDTLAKIENVKNTVLKPLQDSAKAMEKLMQQVKAEHFPDGFADPSSGDIFYAPVVTRKAKQPTIKKL